MRGLADNLPENVTLHENSPVVAIDHAGGIRVTTPNGEVRAKKLFLGVNGFAERFGYYQRRQLPCIRTAAYCYGIEKVARTYQDLGIFP